MRLLLTADPIGGVWSYAVELCRLLATEDVQIALATMGRPLSRDQHRQLDRLSHVQLYESDYRLCWMEDPWGDVETAGQWLLAIAEDFQPDLVHLNDLAHGDLDWRVPVLLVGHSCVLSWWQAVKKEPAPHKQWQQYHDRVRAGVQGATMVAAPSQAMLASLIHYYGPVAASCVLANGSDLLSPVVPSTTASRKELIFAAGRLWDEGKNLGLLTAVAPQLKWPVYVAGEQGDGAGWRVTPHNVQLTGFLPQEVLACYLARSAIFAAPALYEPFGLAILEAARSGCALVLGDIASLRQTWEGAACFVDPTSRDSLRRTLNDLIEHPGQRQRMAELAVQRAALYTGRRMLADYRRCYNLLSEQSFAKQ